MLRQGVEPNGFTLSSVLKSCPFEPGKGIHCQVVKLGLEEDVYVRTALLDLYARGGDVVSAGQLFDTLSERGLVSLTVMITCYAKYGNVDGARRLFEGMEERDIVCWNAMINGYVQQGRPNESLGLFRRMLSVKFRPNEVTVLSVLSACGQLGALGSGRWMHSYMENNGIRFNIQVSTALVDMYCKCGSLEDARLVFDRIIDKDVVAWNSMIVGYAMHGFSQDALELFAQMRNLGLHPTDITFIGVLSACSHAGLVVEGRGFFNLMKEEYGIEPKIEHYGCIVDLLGRAGFLDEAYELVKTMKIEPDPVLWGTLLGACRLHRNISLGENIADLLVQNGLANSGTYILLSNLYAEVGNWDGVARMRTMLKDSGVQKEPGCSSIEVNNKVHEFLAGDLKHPKSKKIDGMLRELSGRLKAHGYTPQTDIVLHDIKESAKEQVLSVHSEKLAIAFGLISTEPETTIKIVKNLRVCTDCHTVTKLISKITGRVSSAARAKLEFKLVRVSWYQSDLVESDPVAMAEGLNATDPAQVLAPHVGGPPVNPRLLNTRTRLDQLEKKMQALSGIIDQVTTLEERLDGFSDDQAHMGKRLVSLEGAVEGNMATLLDQMAKLSSMSSSQLQQRTRSSNNYNKGKNGGYQARSGGDQGHGQGRSGGVSRTSWELEVFSLWREPQSLSVSSEDGHECSNSVPRRSSQ
ncbi:hypothetical protein GIB67_011359 [Kingdonia uniflora]|uniref:DYW domain-containing protein n=1 Tax=Kingdonia uniflora TaxID=39325 RepID=A0A7J7LCT2_9MAGN|nr:hypothetical protein GIB67_011359 [Kingdonia uniflora]